VTIVVGLDRREKARRGVLPVRVGLSLLMLSWLLMLLLAFARNVAPAIAGWPAGIAWLIALVFASVVGLATLLAGGVAIFSSRLMRCDLRRICIARFPDLRSFTDKRFAWGGVISAPGRPGLPRPDATSLILRANLRSGQLKED
jgi:hypothetical protein